jgi:hypothetical protein
MEKRIRIWRVTFDVGIEGIPVPRTDIAHAVGTDDLNSLVDFVRNTVMQTEVTVDVGDNSQQRPVVSFDLRAVEDTKLDVSFIDVNSLVAAGILSLQEPHVE